MFSQRRDSRLRHSARIGILKFNFHRYTDPQNVTHKQTDTASEIAHFSWLTWGHFWPCWESDHFSSLMGGPSNWCVDFFCLMGVQQYNFGGTEGGRGKLNKNFTDTFRQWRGGVGVGAPSSIYSSCANFLFYHLPLLQSSLLISCINCCFSAIFSECVTQIGDCTTILYFFVQNVVKRHT